MSTFENVTVTREANIYFGGNVTSRKVTFADGSFKTLGIMMPGNYTFGTEQAELMEIMAGRLQYRLKDTRDWVKITAGQSFNVPANASFDIQIAELVDYCCSYLD
ncbi:MAG: pyrimidine/purine nucleoside phosphorylase [Methylophaga sp.]|nr:pyrimidine/purine nucleoside phosphorylase [Methylophaga sp.]